MIDHISSYATDYPATKKFFDAAFAPLGYKLQVEFVAEWNTDFPEQRICAFGEGDKPSFWVIEVKQASSPRHTAFAAKTRAQVEAFYQAGLDNGGKDNGQPGLRPMYHEHYFGAFLLDPDGNNIEAVCHTAE